LEIIWGVDDMESLGSLIQAAQATQEARNQSNPIGNRMAAAAMGMINAPAMREAQDNKRLDRYKKLLDLQETISKIKTERMNQAVFGNMAKGMGVLPMEDPEMDNARGVAHDSIGKDNTPVAKTQGNKLLDFINREGLSSASYGPGGFSFSFGKKDKAEKDPLARRAKTIGLATEAAQNEIAGKEGVDPMTGRPRQPRNDEVMKYIPAFESFLSGDDAAYKERMDKIRKAGDPLDLLGGGAVDLNLK
jgi:hypothetical protein